MLMGLWRNTTVREGFEHGRSLNEISEETGLSLEEVLQREVELQVTGCRAKSHARWVRLAQDPDF
jgi:hypothetical protein